MKNTIQDGLWTATFGEVGAILRSLGKHGVTLKHLTRLRDELEYAKRVAEFILRSDFLDLENHNQKCAREIMGHNFFGIEEAIKHFGVNPTRQQLATLSEIPFSEAALEESKNTHVLVAVFPLSILEIRDKVNSQLFYNQSWYNKESFAKKRGEVTWQLVRKTPVNDSTSKNWQEQQALLGKDDEVPTAQVMVYTIIGHFLATGERLFEHFYVRTFSVDSDGIRVHVGYFDSLGLYVYYSWDVNRRDYIGVSSARKF